MLHIANNKSNVPWCTVGNFNVITSTEEKLEGIPYNIKKSFEFIIAIEGHRHTDFSGQSFTSCNNKCVDATIWKTLDKGMINDKWLEIMPLTTISHLYSIGSDNCLFYGSER